MSSRARGLHDASATAPATRVFARPPGGFRIKLVAVMMVIESGIMAAVAMAALGTIDSHLQTLSPALAQTMRVEFLRSAGAMAAGVLIVSAVLFLLLGGRIERGLSALRASKLAEENMRALLAEKQATLDNALIGVWLVRDRVIVSCNRRCEELFGYGPGEMIGRSVRIIYPNDEVYEERGRRVYTVLGRGENSTDEIEAVRKDGSTFWCSTSGRALSPGDPLAGSIWVFADITKQREAMAELRSERDFSDALINSLPGIFGLYDASGNLLRWNANLARISGHSNEEMRRLNVFDLISEGQRRAVRRAVARALHEGYTEGEARLMAASGAQIPYFLTTARIQHAGRTLLIGVGIDLSDRKRAEQEIRRLNEHLERRVHERTAELLAVNHELEAFSYSVSHDLTAPLRGIDGFSRMLEEDHGAQLDELGKSYIRRIRAGTQRMQRLIDDLLGLARVTRDEMRHEPVNLSRAARQILLELQQSAPERHVTAVIASDLIVNGDPNLLNIALSNLLRNAWKFTAKHEAASIELGILHQQGKPVYFVRDDGAGFDMRYAGKLFAPFQRMHQASEFEGTGIGLAIVSRIIQRHGGRIWAESAIERGTTFYFTLQFAAICP